MGDLPYLSSPGNVAKALNAIKAAATPPRVSQDFVKTKLGIPGGSGDQMASFLKRIGFSSPDGTPTETYKTYRTEEGPRALANAIRISYRPLYEHNEYMHECGDKALRELIIRHTGLAADARSVGLIFSTLRNLIALADFSEMNEKPITSAPEVSPPQAMIRQEAPHRSHAESAPLGLNIGYTINLNLPETTNIDVFNAIFKSLREHLLKNDND